MTNPQIGFNELASAQEQPEVLVNAADRAVSALLAGEITIDFTSDANYTLQATDPPDSEDEWAYGRIVMTDAGSPTVLTAARDVIYPDVDSLYTGPSRALFVFVNETAQELTIKRSGQTGVTVGAGESALVQHDGTDIVSVAIASTAASSFASVVTESGSNLNATPSNAGNYTRFTNSGSPGPTYTFDGNESYVTGAEYHGRYTGTDTLTITEANGFTVNPPTDGTLEIPQGGTFTVKIVSATEADLFGITVESSSP